MIAQPVFFHRDDWVVDHVDWRLRIQGGKTIDVASGDGRRIPASAWSARRGCGRRWNRSQTSCADTARRKSCSRASVRVPSASP